MRAPQPEDFGFKPFEIEGKQWGWIIPGEDLFVIASNKWRSMMKWRDLMLDSTVSFYDVLEYRRQYLVSGRDYEDFMLNNQICSVAIKPYSKDLNNDCKLSDVYLNKTADENEEVRMCGCKVDQILYKGYTEEELDYMLREREEAFSILNEINLSRSCFLNMVKVNDSLFDRITLLFIKKFTKFPDPSKM
jgi:hypothetical protein